MITAASPNDGGTGNPTGRRKKDQRREKERKENKDTAAEDHYDFGLRFVVDDVDALGPCQSFFPFFVAVSIDPVDG